MDIDGPGGVDEAAAGADDRRGGRRGAAREPVEAAEGLDNQLGDTGQRVLPPAVSYDHSSLLMPTCAGAGPPDRSASLR